MASFSKMANQCKRPRMVVPFKWAIETCCDGTQRKCREFLNYVVTCLQAVMICLNPPNLLALSLHPGLCYRDICGVLMLKTFQMM